MFTFRRQSAEEAPIPLSLSDPQAYQASQTPQAHGRHVQSRESAPAVSTRVVESIDPSPFFDGTIGVLETKDFFVVPEDKSQALIDLGGLAAERVIERLDAVARQLTI